ncbi:MAG: DoxX family protein [Bacteroidota bacterium]
MTKAIKRMLSADFPSQGRMSITMLIFRSLVAFAMIRTHGIKKVADIEGEIANIPDPFGLGGEFTAFMAIFTNIVLTAFIALGFFTRLSALGILSVTLSGLFLVHWADPWPVKDIPLMYSLVYFLIMIIGPGRYSIDYLIKKRIRPRFMV